MMYFTLGIDFVKNEKAIYHYTKDINVSNILQKDGFHLWATHIKAFEDKKEFNYAQDLWIKNSEELLINKEICESYYDFIKGICPSFKHMFIDVKGESIGNGFNYMISPHFSQCEWYIICFSKASDSKYMWDHYSKNDERYGYSLGFFGDNFINLNNVFLRDVTYDSKRQEEAVKETIREYYHDFCNGMDRDEIKNYLQWHLTEWCVFFKSKEFENEEEVRLAIPFENDRDEKEYKVKSLRGGDNKVSKHIDFIMEKSTVSSITSGPYIKPDDIAILNNEIVSNGYERLYFCKSREC